MCDCCFDYLLFLNVHGCSSREQIVPALGIAAEAQICQTCFFTINHMGFTGGSTLAADLTHISSAHRNFWSLICLVTTVSADSEVSTWHCGLCELLLCVA